MRVRIPDTPPHVSVNRVRIVDLPGAPLDHEVRGKTAYELVSSAALLRYARERATALKLPAELLTDGRVARAEVPRFVDRCLHSPDPPVRTAARAIGKRLGRNLGHVLLALRRGDMVNRQARTDWTAAEWERWAAIEQVWLGGGIVSGRLGALVAQAARRYLAEAGTDGPLSVAVDSHAPMMTMLGAGRYLPPIDRGLCFDFGQTLVKRAYLHFKAGALTKLQTLPPIAVDWADTGTLNAPNPSHARPVLRFVTNTITSTLQQSSLEDRYRALDIMISIAAYVEGGRLLGNGIYAQMHFLADDIRPILARSVSDLTGRPVRIHLIHDGTAAAAVHAGERNSAVIVVGTALGVGFPPSETEGLRSLRLDAERVNRNVDASLAQGNESPDTL